MKKTEPKTYDAYKDSGVEWLGEIPEEWEVKRMKFILKNKLQYGANESGIEYNADLPRYIRITDFGSDGLLSDENKLSLTWEKARYYLLKDGDILFARSGATVGKAYKFKAAISTETNYCFAGYLIRAEVNEKEISSNYLYLYVSSRLFEIWKERILIKATIENIGADKYSTLPIITPPLSEQIEIYRYLGAKTTLIDKAIALKEKQISLLRERQQAIVHQAVTKGLNLHVPMKDSGVDWIGEIPAHWEVKKLKYLLFERNERSSEGKEPLLMVSQTYGLVVRADFHSKAEVAQSTESNKIVYKGDLVFNKLKAHLGVFYKSTIEFPGIVSPDYAVYYSNGVIKDLKYLELLFRCPEYLKEFICRARGIVEGLIRLYTSDLFEIAIPVPTCIDQKQILSFIESFSNAMSNAIYLKEQEIEKLKEFKASLINSAVTGKIKVT